MKIRSTTPLRAGDVFVNRGTGDVWIVVAVDHDLRTFFFMDSDDMRVHHLRDGVPLQMTVEYWSAGNVRL